MSGAGGGVLGNRVVRTEARFASGKRILRFAQKDNQESKGNGRSYVLAVGAGELDQSVAGPRVSKQLRALEFAGAEDSYVGEGAADHGYFVAGVEAGAGLAVFVDLVGHGVALGDAEADSGRRSRGCG